MKETGHAACTAPSGSWVTTVVRAGGADLCAAPGHGTLTSRAAGRASRFATTTRATQVRRQKINTPTTQTRRHHSVHGGTPATTTMQTRKTSLNAGELS